MVQSLLMVYAQLFHSQMEAVLQFLSNVPGPTGNRFRIVLESSLTCLYAALSIS